MYQQDGNVSLSIAVGKAVSGWVRAEGARGFGVEIPSATASAWTAAGLALECLNKSSEPVEADTGVLCRKSDGSLALISGITAAGAFIFPGECWMAGKYTWVRLRSVNTSTGADVQQTGGSARQLSLLQMT